ncbi:MULTISPECIES: UvrD-helicase domain-containing protein [unclassified Mesorhizobium]|uniref:UvrD-helicase domain-containing protein n=1 Tax=unclassified Mesorhizobium TaxID=325217 RepID=UPI001093A45F|nr:MULTISPECIES: UvrD-helicase domain-containing protein [unclassified Mesorhizobium]TGT91858.1 ATP-dependent helicase [Mesorhizobium sp. M8A.F.Ca.ET.161.01.1.1]TGV44883.1 ATP-dependent helicase [Mesorhizobium sp. M8A.F.Ca.ET.142.01.1.1]
MTLIRPNSNVGMDDHVDGTIAEALRLDDPKSFFLFAGAGSGKTRTLVNALTHIRETFRDRLRLRGRQVAVITYTNAACDEIIRRTQYDPLFVVRTIHSFAWQQIQGLNSDIRVWLREALQRQIADLQEEERRGRPGTKASISRLAQIESKGRRLERLGQIKAFTYNPNGDNRERNALNHAEVINIFSSFLQTKPLMQRLLVEKFPFILIDESQDTHGSLVDALLSVQQAHKARFSLGLIGDTMQRIYADGKDRMEDEIPAGWAIPAKKLNHRCPKRIVRLINQVRSAADQHIQEPRDDAIEGWVRFFVFPADTADKPALEQKVRNHMADITADELWKEIDQCKILTLEHHMAARRMGFERLFEALAIDEFRTSFLDGTFGPTRLFTHSVLPLVHAQRRGDKFATTRIVRELSPLLSKDRLKTSEKPAEQLGTAQTAINQLMGLWNAGEPSCGQVLESIAETNLFEIPDRLKAALAARMTPADNARAEDERADPPTEGLQALLEFLECPFSMIEPYAAYVAHEASYDTHQGVKGLEFDRVMVLMDDSEARGFMFGYDKLLGAKAPTPNDVRSQQEGRDNSIERTRRLFYVTCSRARRSLALVAYTENPAAVQAHVLANGWFDPDEVARAVPG